MSETVAEHVLEDTLKNGLKVVFCGTQAGRQSAVARAYYAGRGNKFWQTLYQLRLTPRCLEPQEYRQLLDFGIGLTDLAKLTSGPDAILRKEHFGVANFRERIVRYAPKAVAFNGKRAASVVLGVRSRSLAYGSINQNIATSRIYVLPSTSGAASAYWDNQIWEQFAAELRELH